MKLIINMPYAICDIFCFDNLFIYIICCENFNKIYILYDINDVVGELITLINVFKYVFPCLYASKCIHMSYFVYLLNLGNFIHSTLPVSFRGDTKSCWSLLLSDARGSKRPHTGG